MAGPVGFIDFDIVGDKYGVQRMLKHLDSAFSVEGLAAFLKVSVEPWLRERAKGRFDSEGDDASGKWAPLQQTTIDFRERDGFNGPGPINRRTGELEAYITGADMGIVSVPGLATLTYPKEPPKGKALSQKVSTAQKGRSQPNTVARPILALSERDLGAILTQLAFHVKGWGGAAR